MVGHVAPEAASGGPIALIEDGDTIVIDIERRTIDVEIPSSVLEQRGRTWKPPAPRYRTGVFAKYARLVSSASDGAITSGGW